jgi:dipeptidase D
MSEAIAGLKPEKVWKYFAEISRIPRGSKNETAIARYVMETAASLGLEAAQDEFGNVVVRKPATPGRENGLVMVLQGHLDMVCEKNNDKVHDFLTDPIELVREENYIRGNGTTLGADNGIAVAANLALMEEKEAEHGPLEFLFTVDEETGLTGAANLKPDFLKGRTLMNLDSEEEGELYVGCAGGRNTFGVWEPEWEKPKEKARPLLLSVKRLKGGHSGLEIDKGRGNAIKTLNRVLLALNNLGVQISSLQGGNKSNAIPREAEALVLVPRKSMDEACAVVEKFQTMVKAELPSVEPDLAIFAEAPAEMAKVRVLKKSLQRKILRTISAMPHGVIKMSADVPGLVETSTNVAVITTDKKMIKLTTSQRSSVASEIDESCQTVNSVFELGDAKVEHTDGYPGWKPNLESPILKLARATYFSLYGKEPEVKAVHAGLECGIIGEKYPGMDMVSFGPTLAGVHSPDEKIYFETVEKFWNFLLGILKNFS